MSEDNAFLDLVHRVRAGDQDAAAELVRTYEPAIRRAVKIQLRDRRLSRQFDSMDVCQSVLANFFIRAALGQFELNTSKDLLGLLATMARNNLASRARKPEVVRRADFGADSASPAESKLLDDQPTPSQNLAGRDLLEAVRKRLTPDERYLAEQRALGRPWQELAAESGASAEALRKRLARALDRVSRELGLEDTGTP
jgi:RNA polymerase sigma factor (sigma-70 family)